MIQVSGKTVEGRVRVSKDVSMIEIGVGCILLGLEIKQNLVFCA